MTGSQYSSKFPQQYKHSAMMQLTYQCLPSCEWRATEKPKYSLPAGPLKTSADPISKLKPQIPTDWSKQANAISSCLFIVLIQKGRSTFITLYCVVLDLKSSTQLTSLPDISQFSRDVRLDRYQSVINRRWWRFWCRIRFNPLRWMTACRLI